MSGLTTKIRANWKTYKKPYKIKFLIRMGKSGKSLAFKNEKSFKCRSERSVELKWGPTPLLGRI